MGFFLGCHISGFGGLPAIRDTRPREEHGGAAALSQNDRQNDLLVTQYHSHCRDDTDMLSMMITRHLLRKYQNISKSETKSTALVLKVKNTLTWHKTIYHDI